MLKHGKKKTSEVAYVPLVETTQVIAEAPTKIDTPDYPDVGVAYANYSKKLQSGNNFRLSKQEPYERTTLFGWTAGAGILAVGPGNKEGKDIYITEITLTCYSDTACFFSVYDLNTAGDYNTLAIIVCGAGQTNSAYYHFASPILLKKLYIAVAPNVAVTGRLSTTITGWYEDKL